MTGENSMDDVYGEYGGLTSAAKVKKKLRKALLREAINHLQGQHALIYTRSRQSVLSKSKGHSYMLNSPLTGSRDDVMVELDAGGSMDTTTTRETKHYTQKLLLAVPSNSSLH